MDKYNAANQIENKINSKDGLNYKYTVSFSKNKDLNLWVYGGSREIELDENLVFAPEAKLIIAYFDKEDNYKFSLKDTYAGETQLFEDLVIKGVLKDFFLWGTLLTEKILSDTKPEEPVYEIKLFDGDFGSLFFDATDQTYYTGKPAIKNCEYNQKFLFTKDEIEEMKKDKDIAVDWAKAKLIEYEPEATQID